MEFVTFVRSAPHRIDTPESHTVFAIQSEPIECAVTSPHTATFAVVSRPAGGTADFDGGTLVPDAAGVWTCSMSLGSTSAVVFRLAVGAPALLEWPPVARRGVRSDGAERPTRERLAILGSFVRDAANAARLADLGTPGLVLGGVALTAYGS